MKTMKYLVFAMIIPASLLLVSCNKKNNDENRDLTKDVVGTYKGTLTDDGLKDSIDATTDITRADNNLVQIHCYSSVLDTTFVMELFENGDSMMICNTGEDFRNAYGHNRMEIHHMMGDPNWQNWTHHMNEEHNKDDEHFGGFDLIDHNFSYRFVISADSTLRFSGDKQ